MLGKQQKKVELLAPAGSWESLSAALDSGADGVYFGASMLNMRANARNFELSALAKVVERCHAFGAKAFITLNTIVYDHEMGKVEGILTRAKEVGVDAVITWDFAVIQQAKKLGIPFHISTQASISNMEALRFYASLGAECIVLARELSLESIGKLKAQALVENLPVKIECFCHGAMCVALSGRCFTSQFLSGRSANRGDCLQPCRREYKVTDAVTGQELRLESNYVMSPKDLCTLPILDKLMDAGIDVLKIEGRSRPPEYVSAVTRAYRTAIDAHAAGALDETLKASLLETLHQVYNRKFSTGFFLGTPTADDYTDLYGSAVKKEKRFVGRIRNVYQRVGVYEVEITAESLPLHAHILVTGKTTGVVETRVTSLRDAQNQTTSLVCKGECVGMRVESSIRLRANDKVFLYG